MGMNEQIKELIRSVANNNLQKAKAFAQIIVENETSEKNRQFCSQMKARLENQSLNLLELPYSIQSIAIFENVSMSFKEDRYYLSEAEKEVFDKILRKQKVYGYMEELGVPMINTTLLYGESGTGKTMFGRYIAYKLGKPFLYLKFSDCIDSLMGKTAKNISLVFDFARENECVLMLDEIDTVATKRTGVSDHGCDGETNRITVTLMQEFDKLSSGTIVIGATNRIDRMDEAFLRRFSIRHEMKRLDFAGRREMVERFFKSINISIPFDVEEYCKADKTQAEISIDMIDKLAESIESDLRKGKK